MGSPFITLLIASFLVITGFVNFLFMVTLFCRKDEAVVLERIKIRGISFN